MYIYTSLSLCIYIYIYKYTYTYTCIRPVGREFRDVVFEDAGFDSNSLLTLNSRRCGDFTPKADMGQGFDND